LTHWFPAYVGLGSNLDEPKLQVRVAAAAMATLERTRLITCSALYGSRPLGPVPQPEYCNAVVALLTQLSALQLLHALRALELQQGRAPARARWGPRRIDLDLLIYSNECRSSDELTIPHPGIVQRNFVLYPLAEVAPDLQISGVGRVADLAQRVGSEGLWPMDSKWMAATDKRAVNA
jgi:2-amino-4-hydroxy-6-hydroxymethyldihydropteridine diphosphokinase